jgi:hypothetical protein
MLDERLVDLGRGWETSESERTFVRPGTSTGRVDAAVEELALTRHGVVTHAWLFSR